MTVPEGENGFVEVAGSRLEWRWVGPRPAQAPTIVFLHEGLGSAAQWRDLPARLAADSGFGALVYSRAGYGRSSPLLEPRPVAFMHTEATEALPALLERFGIDRPVLFGHSDGASIALIYAASGLAPRPLGLILEAAHVVVEPVCLESIGRLDASYRDPVAGAELRERFARHHDRADATVRAWFDVWLRPEFAAWDIRRVLPSIACPVLAIQGVEDAYGTPLQLALLAAGIKGPVATHLLSSCGHAPHRDRRHEVETLARDFLGSLTG